MTSKFRIQKTSDSSDLYGNDEKSQRIITTVSFLIENGVITTWVETLSLLCILLYIPSPLDYSLRVWYSVGSILSSCRSRIPEDPKNSICCSLKHRLRNSCLSFYSTYWVVKTPKCNDIGERNRYPVVSLYFPLISEREMIHGNVDFIKKGIWT